MPRISRRSFIGGTAAAAAGITAAGITANSAGAATEQAAAASATGTLADVQHVVILMQENRSFDHYYGTLQGVRGFGDRSAITISGGNSVFNQPNGSSRQYPWQLTKTSVIGETGGQCNGDLDHSWATQQQAFNNGKMDAWVAAKGNVRTLGYLNRSDIPFHYALADAYTIMDGYHCSIRSATGPNRTYLWSGQIDPSGTAGGPAYDGGSESGLSWITYAENLQNAGISWKVYQASDNYGDNGLEYFKQFQNLSSSSPLYPGVEQVPDSSSDVATAIANQLTADVKAGTLPQVSWIVPNQEYSEHPYATPKSGAYFINLVLNALASNAAVLNSTVLFINYDENDGLFDHVPPPTPEAGTAGEFTQGKAIGLGFRVPMTIVSPWTRGGKVSSEVADHTSVIQFLEKWSAAIGKPANCPNISAWRRSVCSDLTGVFDFTSPVTGLPSGLPGTSTLSMYECAVMPNPSPTTNALPSQESGTRPARPLPYQAGANVTGTSSGLSIALANTGHWATKGAHFWVYDNTGAAGPWPFTVGANASRTVTAAVASGAYDVTVLGPNRFLREFKGNSATAGASTEAAVTYTENTSAPSTSLNLKLTNSSSSAVTFTITSNHYTSGSQTQAVAAGGSWSGDLTSAFVSSGWYDFTVTSSADSTWSRRFTGHLENGQPSITG